MSPSFRLHAERPPNPESIKWVLSEPVAPDGVSASFKETVGADVSPLAAKLFAVDGVVGVFFAANFITTTKREDVERGQVVAIPGTITPHTKFKAEVYVLSKEEGGRHTPFFNGYRPQFYIRTTDVTGVANLPEGVEMVMPGDNVSLEVELITPVALEKELRFAIREGGHTVGDLLVGEGESESPARHGIALRDARYDDRLGLQVRNE